MIELATEVRWHDRRFSVPIERIRYSEELGYDAVFTAEGFGSEGLVPLGYIAAHTSRLKLGTRIAQVTSRPPALAAMAFQTIDHLAGGGRVMIGLGSSSPVAAEGFYGRGGGVRRAGCATTCRSCGKYCGVKRSSTLAPSGRRPTAGRTRR